MFDRLPLIVTDIAIAVATTLVGWAVLNLIDKIAAGVTAAQAGLLP